MGRVNVFIVALAMYAVRYIGYSYITVGWMSFPFEALEVFTNTLMRIASIEYTGEIAPKGTILHFDSASRPAAQFTPNVN